MNDDSLLSIVIAAFWRKKRLIICFFEFIVNFGPPRVGHHRLRHLFWEKKMNRKILHITNYASKKYLYFYNFFKWFLKLSSFMIRSWSILGPLDLGAFICVNLYMNINENDRSCQIHLYFYIYQYIISRLHIFLISRQYKSNLKKSA